MVAMKPEPWAMFTQAEMGRGIESSRAGRGPLSTFPKESLVARPDSCDLNVAWPLLNHRLTADMLH
jgi:hypothetical protein